MNRNPFDVIADSATPDQVLAAVERTTRQIAEDWEHRFSDDGPALDGAQTVEQAVKALGFLAGETVADLAVLARMVGKLADVIRDDREAARLEQAREEQARRDLLRARAERGRP